MKGKDTLSLAICIAIPLAMGAVAGRATVANISGWYAGLEKPSFNPPSWVFGPVWTTLYLLMGISLFRVWQAPPGSSRSRGLAAFATQLAFNFAWSFLFFAFHRMGWALVDILLLWVAILAMIAAFRKVSPWAAYLQIPYLLWVTFAAVLNAALLKLN